MGGCQAAHATRAVEPIRFHHGIRTVIETAQDPNLTEIDRGKNLESYYLFWLETTARSPEFMEASNELRSIVNYVRIFQNLSECTASIEKVSNGKIFLIANLCQGLAALADVHDHRTLDSVYLYDTTNKNDRPTNQYRKIRGIYDSFAMAKRYLEDDIRLHTDFDDPIMISIEENSFPFSQPTSISDYDDEFRLFLQLVHVNADDVYDADKSESLMEICRKYYEGNENEIDYINEFKRIYESSRALFWYMRGSCFHRLLSRAFLERDKSILVDMYSFIVDIDRSIRRQLNSSERLYRGQFLSIDEWNRLKNAQEKTIIMQCFLMAQTSRDESERLLQMIQPSDLTSKRILFEIEGKNGFTLINHSDLAASSTEKMALFPLGSMFRIDEVTETTVKLSLCTEVENRFDDLKNESPEIIRGLLTYLKHGPTTAISYFREILSTSAENDFALRSSIFGQLAFLYNQQSSWNVASQMYRKSLHFGAEQCSLYLYYLDQAANNSAINEKNWIEAKRLWLLKLTIEQNFASPEEQAKTYMHLVRAAREMKQYADVVEYSTAAIKGLSVDHRFRSIFQAQIDWATKEQNSS